MQLTKKHLKKLIKEEMEQLLIPEARIPNFKGTPPTKQEIQYAKKNGLKKLKNVTNNPKIINIKNKLIKSYKSGPHRQAYINRFNHEGVANAGSFYDTQFFPNIKSLINGMPFYTAFVTKMPNDPHFKTSGFCGYYEPGAAIVLNRGGNRCNLLATIGHEIEHAIYEVLPSPLKQAQEKDFSKIITIDPDVLASLTPAQIKYSKDPEEKTGEVVGVRFALGRLFTLADINALCKQKQYDDKGIKTKVKMDPKLYKVKDALTGWIDCKNPQKTLMILNRTAARQPQRRPKKQMA